MAEDQRQSMQDEIDRRDEVIARQSAEIALLKQAVDALTRRIFGAKSESLDPGQLELQLDPDASKKAPAVAPEGPGPAAEGDHRSRRGKKPRQPRIPEHLPVIEEILDPPEVQADPDAWRHIGEEVREQLDYRPGRFLRRRLVRRKYVRKGDALAKPVIAGLPPSLQERCIATPALVAEVVAARFADHLPYYRQAGIFARQGVRLDRKTLCGWALLASDWLAAIYRGIEAEHRACGYLQIDETPIRYLDPGHGKARNGYLWTSNIPGGNVLYRWHEGRDRGALTGLLGDGGIKRIIQCDGYSAYPAWSRDKPGVTLAGCHAHARRKFHEARDQAPKLVGWIMRQFGHLYLIERRLRQARAGPALREAIRASQSRMVHARLKKLFDMLAGRRWILPQSLLGKAVRYALNQWANLEVCMGDGRVEIDRNLVENAIRPTKLGAKNWIFVGRETAGEKTAILYTVVENCRRLAIDPREYLEDVLTRLPAMKAVEAASLTPANWLRARQPSRRRAA
jgi:transposase